MSVKKDREAKKKFWLKRWGRLGILLGIKESYLFFRNLIGLRVHPVKTLRAMQREKDRSQQVLVLGLPVYMLGAGLVGIWLGRRLLGTTVRWGWPAKLSFLGVVGVSLLIGGYLGYWILKTWRVKYE